MQWFSTPTEHTRHSDGAKISEQKRGKCNGSALRRSTRGTPTELRYPNKSVDNAMVQHSDGAHEALRHLQESAQAANSPCFSVAHRALAQQNAKHWLADRSRTARDTAKTAAPAITQCAKQSHHKFNTLKQSHACSAKNVMI